MNRSMLYTILFVSILISGNKCNSPKPEATGNRIDFLLDLLHDHSSDQVMVVAHRGDWRNAPENSVAAIESAIRLGVDIVEIDVRETKDGELVLMHDKSINRTTNGGGYVSDWTLDSLKRLFLRDGCQTITSHKIPTLEEALMASKGKILVNLDKSYPIIDKCYQVALKTGTLNQIILKGDKPFFEVQRDIGDYLDKIIYMPVRNLAKPGSKQFIEEYMNEGAPVAFEFVVPSDTISLLDQFPEIHESGVRIWVNSLWPHHNAGHDDEKAFYDIEVYDWFIDHAITIIQTDRPVLLLEYLRDKGFHD
jgi:glycerophosphoryl diester phosphodiesterase